MESSCIDCKDRKVGCHGTCEKYKKWKESVDNNNEKRRTAIRKWEHGYYHK